MLAYMCVCVYVYVCVCVRARARVRVCEEPDARIACVCLCVCMRVYACARAHYLCENGCSTTPSNIRNCPLLATLAIYNAICIYISDLRTLR